MNKVKRRRKNISIPKEKEHSTINYQNNFDYRASLSANRPFKNFEKAKSVALEENLELSAQLELSANLKRSLLNLERSIRDSSVASRITEVGRFLESVELFHRTLHKKIASLRKSKESSTSTEKEIAHARYTNLSDNPLIDISRYLDKSAKSSSSENIELALEVEINENLKRALAKATNNSSDLLDVTIIRPTDSETTHETTVALNKTEVRDFISLVEQHRRTNNDKSERNGDKEKLNSIGNGNGHRKKKHIKSDGTDDSILIDSSTYNKTGISGNQKQVYATANTFDKLKASLACQNKNKEEDKPGTPCLCQHCGVVGVLVQSQKGPVATFPSVGECTHDEPTKPKHRNKYERERRPPSPKDTKHRRIDLRKHRSIDQMDLLREINDRIKILEKRIAVQEETAVPKEYLKNVLQKILTHYNFRQLQYSSRTTTKMKNNFTQYSTTKYISQKEPTFQCDHKHNIDRCIDRHADKNVNTNVERDTDRNTGRNTDIKSKKFQIHSLLQNFNQHADNRRDNREHEDNQTNRPSPQQENVKDRQMKENIPEKDYWLWGEEVVKPGCDLKNKILKLLEEKATNKFTNSNEQRKSYQQTPEPKHYTTTPCNNHHDKLRDIKIECDENSIYLNVDEVPAYNPHNTTTNRVTQQNCYANPNPPKTDRTSNEAKRKYNALMNMLPLQQNNYPFDVKKTIDDSTFRKNIEAYKDKFREKPKPPVEEKYFNEYACNSITTVSKASMDYIAQKMKNINFLESGLTREKEQYINERYMSPENNPLGAFLKDKIHTRAFRPHKVEPELDPETPVQVTFVNPKINHWSDGSSNSDARFISKQHARMEELNEGKICMEEKESLIYKLDFLKGLAKNKNIDQDKVFDRIWNQAKNTAKSKKDAVFIKIPIKTLNKYETNNNVVEMELTLEQLETVVKNAKAPRKPSQSTLAPLRLNYKSSSDVDVALRRHREMKKENRNMLNSKRNQSAKSNKHKEKTRYKEKI